VFLHEEFHIDTYSNDIAILKVQNISEWVRQILRIRTIIIIIIILGEKRGRRVRLTT
jgi:hypothetical protein